MSGAWVLVAGLVLCGSAGSACAKTEPGATATEANIVKPAPAPVEPAAPNPEEEAPAQPTAPTGADTPIAIGVAPGAPKKSSSAAPSPEPPAKPSSAASGPSKPTSKPSSPAPATPARVADPVAAAPKKKPAPAPPAKAPAPQPSAAAPPAEPRAPEPPPPVAPVAPVAPRATVAVPRTNHVRIDVPPGLQHWLDEDDRMRPWLGKAVAAADGCYAELRQRDPQAGGTIEVAVTMHKNARPSASVTSIPGPLKSLVVCVTSKLWSVKMPLFTGDEGARYSLKAVFTP